LKKNILTTVVASLHVCGHNTMTEDNTFDLIQMLCQKIDNLTTHVEKLEQKICSLENTFRRSPPTGHRPREIEQLLSRQSLQYSLADWHVVIEATDFERLNYSTYFQVICKVIEKSFGSGVFPFCVHKKKVYVCVSSEEETNRWKWMEEPEIKQILFVVDCAFYQYYTAWCQLHEDDMEKFPELFEQKINYLGKIEISQYFNDKYFIKLKKNIVFWMSKNAEESTSTEEV
jgi:hypothetical protein